MSNPTIDPQDPGPEPTAPEGTGVAGPGAEGAADALGDLGEREDEVLADLEGSLEESGDHDLVPYQAVVLASFGGPEGPDEVLPFLRRVTAGRGIPDERLEEVGEHYYLFGGRSPINEQNRALIAALEEELARRDIPLPVLLGNRFSEPFITDTFRELHEEGMTRLLVASTSAYSSYSSCRSYREEIAKARLQLLDEGREVHVDKVRQYWNHPGFSAANARIVTEGVRQMQERTGTVPHVLFVTHSIPDAMDETSGPGDGEGHLYQRQHRELAAAIAAEVAATLGTGEDGIDHDLVYCSRSGPPQQPWLEPDVNDALTALAGRGVKHVLVAPIGFVSDHMEVIYDLDTEAKQTAEELGLDMLRVPTVGTDPEYVSGLVDLLVERAAEAREEPVAQPPCWPGTDARPSVCEPGCCPNLRRAAPADCGQD